MPCSPAVGSPIFARVFEEYSRHRGFVIDPAPPAMPTGKPHVERQVPYVREHFFRGETFLDRDHAQREVIHWCVDTAGRRLHGTTQQRPLEVFEAVERPALRPLEAERFDPPRWATVTVHPDHHIRFGRALYSVPHRYLRHTVDVRGDTQLVRIYHRGELVKTCPTQPPGGRHTDYTDYPAEKTAYAMRDPQYMIDRARRHGPRSGLPPRAGLRARQRAPGRADRPARSRPGRHRSRLPRGPGDPGHAAFPTPVRQLCSPPDRHGGILMDITNSLKAVLTRLRLSPILQTLVDRLVYARKATLSHADFLELVLQDETDRREQQSLQRRLDKAGFTEATTLEGFDWDAPVTFDRDRVRDLFGLGFLDRHEDAIFMGPVGVGKTHYLKSALEEGIRAREDHVEGHEFVA